MHENLDFDPKDLDFGMPVLLPAAVQAAASIAFDHAITTERLSVIPDTINYAGDYIYTGRDELSRDTFKDIYTNAVLDHLPIE